MRAPNFFVVTFGATIVFAFAGCTYDFDPFEGNGDTDAASSSDGGGDGSNDGSKTDASDAGSCQPKASCYTTAQTCQNDCESARRDCLSNCGGGGNGSQCRRDCSNTRDTCRTDCTSTCRTCAGTDCAAACP